MINNTLTVPVEKEQPVYNQVDNFKTKHKQVTSVVCRKILEDNSATTIQKYVRGYLARKPHLPSNLYPQYHAQCEKVKGSESHSMPQAQGGRTEVYLPQEMPEVVLKKSGRKNAIKRFHQMQKVRSILNSQNSSHLIIPKASLCQDFLVEQRLPIREDSFHNMGLYLSQPQLFDEAVREMTRLFSKIYLSDLTCDQRHPFSSMPGIQDQVRYDNMPMYIVEENGKKKGKIGLIDLESLHTSPAYDGLETLVRIFPLHFNVIKEEASKLKMEFDERRLEDFAKYGKKYLEAGFTKHLEWLKQKGVFSNSSSEPFQVSPQRKEELTTLLENELLNLNQGINGVYSAKKYSDKPQKNFFTGNPEEMAKELAKSILPLLIDNIKVVIENCQNKLSVQDMTDSHLVSLRSPVIKFSELYDSVEMLILQNQKIKFEKGYEDEGRMIAMQLASEFMYGLVDGGELFYFDPGLYPGVVYNNCWIRY